MSGSHGDYHLLVAQNFLSNISRDGTHDDTTLRIFNRPGIPTLHLAHKVSSAPSCPADIESEQRCLLSAPLPADRRRSSASAVPSTSAAHSRRRKPSPFLNHKSLPEFAADSLPPPASDTYKKRKSRTPKKSLLHRLTRIVSSEEGLPTREEACEMQLIAMPEQLPELCLHDDEEAGRSSPSTQLNFLKRLRSTLVRGERSYLCTPLSSHPLAVLAYFPFHSRAHDRATLHTSQERLRHHSGGLSADELRPLEFKEGEEVTYGHLIARPRMRPNAFSLSARSPRREMFEDRKESIATLLVDEPSEPYNPLEDEKYDPHALTEIDAIKKSTMRFNGFVGSVVAYTPGDELKKQMNEKFREKFSHVSLSYSKFKSIKREMLAISRQCDIDLLTLAHAFVYFERVISKGVISKDNRKLVAGACILLAVKVNDLGAVRLKEIVECVECTFRIARRELLQFELPVCAALRFDLLPPQTHLQPHYNKLLFGAV